jgi:ADP-heptose:LPS heptosyltransferase
MAAAFGLRSVVLFGASDPAIWAPWRTAHQVLTAPAAGLRDLPSDAVIQALGRFRVPA